MPRYYFDLIEGDEVILDEEGLELSSIAKVQEEAARSLADLARDAIRLIFDKASHTMAIGVRDDDGPVMQIRFTFDVDNTRQ
jgi:hypothetical protein